MALPKSAGLTSKYKQIWKEATGRNFDECLCGNGFNRLYTICSHYNNKLLMEERVAAEKKAEAENNK